MTMNNQTADSTRIPTTKADVIYIKWIYLGVIPKFILSKWQVLCSMLCLTVIGCTAPLERKTVVPTALTQDYCNSLDRDHRTWGALAKFSGGLAGTGGLATLPISEDAKATRLTVGISAAVMGAFAAAAIYIEQDAASTWAKKCSE